MTIPQAQLIAEIESNLRDASEAAFTAGLALGLKRAREAVTLIEGNYSTHFNERRIAAARKLIDRCELSSAEVLARRREERT